MLPRFHSGPSNRITATALNRQARVTGAVGRLICLSAVSAAAPLNEAYAQLDEQPAHGQNPFWMCRHNIFKAIRPLQGPSRQRTVQAGAAPHRWVNSSRPTADVQQRVLAGIDMQMTQTVRDIICSHAVAVVRPLYAALSKGGWSESLFAQCSCQYCTALAEARQSSMGCSVQLPCGNLLHVKEQHACCISMCRKWKL
jgi:hypothetical protein